MKRLRFLKTMLAGLLVPFVPRTPTPGYERKPRAAITVDDSNDRVDVDFPDQPWYSFSNDPDTGLYLNGVGDFVIEGRTTAP